MASPKGWVYKLDGVDLNDWENFMVESLPEVENGPSFERRMVEMADDFPVAVGSTPLDARWTLNLYAVEQHPAGAEFNPVLVISDATWQSRLAALDAVLTRGAHTLTLKVRGMTVERSVAVWYESKGINYRERRISITMGVPKPVLQ